MKKIAITGNIASGKSILEKHLKNIGYKTLCLDNVTNELYSDNSFKKILFSLFNTNKKDEISEIVFKDKNKLDSLQKEILPLIKNKMFSFFNENKKEQVVFVAAPTLFEAGFDKYFDEIIFISSNENLRLERLLKRDNIKKDMAELKVKSQLDENKKIPKCNYIIKNNGTINEFMQEIELLKAKLNIL